MKKRIAFHTLGCKLNFSETSTISRDFGLQDFEIVDFDQKADFYVVHTCSVTASAEKKCKSAVKQAVNRNPDAQIAVLGCAVQANAEMFRKMEGVSWVLDNQNKFALKSVIENAIKNSDFNSSEAYLGDIHKTKTFIPSYSVGDRTRSFLKVQDGCDYFCTYCSIPFMRGRSRSASISETIETAREVAKQNVKEIVLTGVNIGDFGRLQNENFFQLLQHLNLLEGVNRIRISSIEPELLTDQIIEFVANSMKLLPHFHIPLQSGSDKILISMKRKYLREVFTNRVHRIKQLMPHACIAVDVILGFPGETADDFEDTYQFINQLDVSYLHVFSYSERPKTMAISFEGKVTEFEKRERSQKLHQLSDIKKHLFYQSQIGTIQDVLWESDIENNLIFGFTGNYVKVKTQFLPHLVNSISKVKVGEMDRNCICEVEIL